MSPNLLFPAAAITACLVAAPASAAPAYVRAFPVSGGPHSVAVAPDGNILVTELGLDRVEEFTPTGTSVRHWGTNGSGPGQFYSPVAIVFTATGNILVTDHGNGRIQEFTRTGAFVRQLGNGLLSAPGGIDVDSQGNIYVAEWGGTTALSKFNTSGALVNHRGVVPGLGSMQYKDVMIAPGDVVYALDGFGRILQFTNGFVYVGSIASSGNEPGQLAQPEGLALGPQGQIYVADTANNRIQAFGTNGAVLETWGTYGFTPPQFYAPTGLDVTSDGLLFIADKFNGMVSVWSDAPTPATPTSWGALKASYRGVR
jgi:DNA-binding beta-propeller fold protein YncE